MNWLTRVSLIWFGASLVACTIAVFWNLPAFSAAELEKATPRLNHWPFAVAGVVMLGTFIRIGLLIRKAEQEVANPAPACPYCLYTPPAEASVCPDCGRPYSHDDARAQWRRFALSKKRGIA